MDWGQWTQQVNGQAVNVEDDLGPQCYGLLQNYATNVVGYPGTVSTQYGSHPGYAINAYEGFDQNGLSQYFKKLGPYDAPQRGDIAFWNWGSTVAPMSHVAIVENDQGSALNVWSQNSPQQYTTLQPLPKSGIAGYLRPLNGVAGSDGSTTVTPNSVRSSDNSGGSNPFDPFGLYTPNNPIWGSMQNLFGAGLKSIVSPQLQTLYSHLFMPSTYIRILSGMAAFWLLILGVILIVLDYRKHSSNES